MNTIMTSFEGYEERVLSLLDPAFIDEAAEYKFRRRPSPAPILAAAACAVLAVGAAAILLKPGGPGAERETYVVPPVRYTENNSHSVYLGPFTFDEALSLSDAVARVRIGDWLGEDTENGTTFFEATVLQRFKGDIPDRFTLSQEGCSTGTVKFAPLFTGGNELLLFLRRGVNEDGGLSDKWGIFDPLAKVLFAAYDDDGNRYYYDRGGLFEQYAAVELTNYNHTSGISRQVFNNAVAADPLLAELDYPYPFPAVFAEADIEALFENR